MSLGLFQTLVACKAGASQNDFDGNSDHAQACTALTLPPGSRASGSAHSLTPSLKPSSELSDLWFLTPHGTFRNAFKQVTKHQQGEIQRRGGFTEGVGGGQRKKPQLFHRHLPSRSSYYILFLQPVLSPFVQPSVIDGVIVPLRQKFDVTVLPGKDKTAR